MSTRVQDAPPPSPPAETPPSKWANVATLALMAPLALALVTNTRFGSTPLWLLLALAALSVLGAAQLVQVANTGTPPPWRWTSWPLACFSLLVLWAPVVFAGGVDADLSDRPCIFGPDRAAATSPTIIMGAGATGGGSVAVDITADTVTVRRSESGGSAAVFDRRTGEVRASGVGVAVCESQIRR